MTQATVITCNANGQTIDLPFTVSDHSIHGLKGLASNLEDFTRHFMSVNFWSNWKADLDGIADDTLAPEYWQDVFDDIRGDIEHTIQQNNLKHPAYFALVEENDCWTITAFMEE